jgi:ribonuclease VapC
VIVVDTSAVVAVLFGEPGTERLRDVLLQQPCTMTAATRVELGIVVEVKAGPAGTQLLDELLDRLEVRVVDVDADLASEAMASWRRFRKGRHRASLNFGDTFSYALAVRNDAALLFVGDDFTHTDVRVA